MTPFAAWCLPSQVGEPSWEEIPSEGPGRPALRVATLGPDRLMGLCRTLRDARLRALTGRSLEEIAHPLGRAAARLMDERDPLGREAHDLLPGHAGLSPEMARVVVAGMARDWLPDRLEALVTAEFGDERILEEFRPGPGGGRVRAIGPGLTLHVGAGSVPGVSVTSGIRALLVRSSALVKPGRGDVALSVLFARALREEDPELGDCMAVLYWPGGDSTKETSLGTEADLVVAYGSDASVAALRNSIPVTTRLVAYHHRVSFAMVAREALTAPSAAPLAAKAARAVAVFDQQGCVSPHLIYVETGGEVSPRDWARLVARQLEELQSSLPAGPLRHEEAGLIQQALGVAELEAVAGGGEVLRDAQLRWAVVYGDGPAFTPSCLGRTVRVSAVSDLGEIPGHLGDVAPHLQSVALECDPERRLDLASSLAEAGVTRVTRFDRMPWPPAWWHHDGRGPLRDLVRWVDVEG